MKGRAHGTSSSRGRRDRCRHGRPGARRRLPHRPHAVRPATCPPVRLVAIADVNGEWRRRRRARYGYERAETHWHAIADAPTTSTWSASSSPTRCTARSSRACSPPASTCCARSRWRRPSTTRGHGRRRRGRRTATGTGFVYRRSPGHRRDRPAVQHGALGKRCTSTAATGATTPEPDRRRWPGATRAAPGSGALADIGSHLIDLAEFLCGPIASVSGATFTTMVKERAVPLGTTFGHATARAQRRLRAGRERRRRHLHRHFARGRRRPSRSPGSPPGTPTRSASRSSPRAAPPPGTWTGPPSSASPTARTIPPPTATARSRRARPTRTSRAACRWTSPASASARATCSATRPGPSSSRSPGIDGALPPVATFDDGVRDLQLLRAVVESASAGAGVPSSDVTPTSSTDHPADLPPTDAHPHPPRSSPHRKDTRMYLGVYNACLHDKPLARRPRRHRRPRPDQRRDQLRRVPARRAPADRRPARQRDARDDYLGVFEARRRRPSPP